MARRIQSAIGWLSTGASVTALVMRGAPIATRLRSEVIATAAILRDRGGTPPRLATILVGRHAAAEAYQDGIKRTMESVGIRHGATLLPTATTPDDFVAAVLELNADPGVTGVLVLMPLPPHLGPDLVIEHLSPLKDVDGLTPTNAGRLYLGLPSLRPSTPQGGMEILDHYGIHLAGLNAVVIGRSNVVGRPLATMLTLRHATVTVCHRQTRDLALKCRGADLVAVAAGHPGLLRGDMVRPGAIVVDFGVNVVDDALVGDVDYAAVSQVAGAITPVPGGTGPVTRLVLARNTIAAGFAAIGGSLDHVAFATVDDRSNGEA